MRGSLVIIAALCVIAAADASSVKFVSVDEGQNGKGKTERSGVSEGTDPVIKEKAEELVKKISDGTGQLFDETVKSLGAGGSPASDRASEGVKKAESSKVQKRDVRRALKQMARRGMKRAQMRSEEQQKIFNGRKMILKYLSLQKTVFKKATESLITALSHLVTDPKDRDAVIAALKTFEDDVERAHDKMINDLTSEFGEGFAAARKFVRADDVPALMNMVNQRNPVMLVPLLLKLITGISGAASIADMATSFSGTRSNVPDVVSLLDMMKSAGSIPQIIDY